MGSLCCSSKGSSFDRRVTKEIDDRLEADIAKIPRTHRILLIGPGESGKSTIIKQMIKIHRGSIPNDTLQWASSKIKMEVVSMIKILCRASINLKIDLDSTDDDEHKYDDIQSIRDKMCNLEVNPNITPDIVAEMKLLWSNKGIKATLDQRHRFQIADHVEYWYNSRLDDIFLSDLYTPSFGDYLRLRLRSTGCVEESFITHLMYSESSAAPPKVLTRVESASSDVELMGSSAQLVWNPTKGAEHTLTFIDVGGQRCERKKWFNMMKDNINCVLYVIGISEYDMMCFEDEKTPRMTEALTLFETVLEKGFMDGEKKTVTLFFNKYDLLVKKLKDSNSQSFRHYYDDFPLDKDDRNANDICDFIFMKFKRVFDKFKKNGDIHYHCTTAMDTNQIEKVVHDIVLHQIKLINCKMETFVPL